MAKEPGKEFIAIDQTRKMKYFSAVGKTVFQTTCQVLRQNLQTPLLNLRVRGHGKEIMSLPKVSSQTTWIFTVFPHS